MLVTIHITKHTLVVVAGDGGDGVEVAVVAAVVVKVEMVTVDLWQGGDLPAGDSGGGGVGDGEMVLTEGGWLVVVDGRGGDSEVRR
ncbi:hypothetical protein Tco_0879463 [Tanacetum coccineum]